MLLRGGEDPWLCVTDFSQICLFRHKNFLTEEKAVNSGLYLAAPPDSTFAYVTPRVSVFQN